MGILWDVMCLAFLLIQRRIFLSYYHLYVVADLEAAQALVSIQVPGNPGGRPQLSGARPDMKEDLAEGSPPFRTLRNLRPSHLTSPFSRGRADAQSGSPAW